MGPGSTEMTLGVERTDSTMNLLPAACRGDERAVALLMSRMGPFLRRVGHGRLPAWARGRAETEDLVQESLIRALRHMPRFQGQSIRDLRNWLQAVFRNLVIDEARHIQRRGVGQELPDELAGDDLSPEERLAEQQRTDVFELALTRLDETVRVLVIHRLQHGDSFQDLADRFGKPSADAARMAYNRALKKFRDEVRRIVSASPGQDVARGGRQLARVHSSAPS